MLLIGIALILPGTALAQGGSTCQSYNPQLCSVASNHGSSNNGSPAGVKLDTLPFTGLDVGLLAIGGAVLLGGGLAMRRVSRPLG